MGNHSLVKFLLSCPQITTEEVNCSTGDLKLTAIWWAACNGHTKIVKALVEAGANPDPERTDVRRPLHLAANHGHAEVVQALVASGHPLDVQDHKGRTALHWASIGFSMWGCQRRKNNVVKCLLEAGACSTLQDNEGLIAADVAREAGNFEVERLVQSW